MTLTLDHLKQARGIIEGHSREGKPGALRLLDAAIVRLGTEE